jgi:hypothetical protein
LILAAAKVVTEIILAQIPIVNAQTLGIPVLETLLPGFPFYPPHFITYIEWLNRVADHVQKVGRGIHMPQLWQDRFTKEWVFLATQGESRSWS